MTATDLEQMAEKADMLAAKFREPATIEVVRALLNDAGVRHARNALSDALDTLTAAQAAKRDADRAEREAAKVLDGAELEADWALVPPDVNDAGAKLLAADKAAWKKRETAKDPKVVAAAAALRQAEHTTAEARDALTMADKRLAACRADLEAAIATLNALVLALPARKAAQ